MAHGIYHKYNVMLFRILHILYNSDERINTRQLAGLLGVEPVDITDRIQSYAKFGYITRSKKKYTDAETGRKVRLLNISKYGRDSYLKMRYRLNHGFDLKRKLNKYWVNEPTHIDHYFGITKQGALEFGITKEQIAILDEMFKELGKRADELGDEGCDNEEDTDKHEPLEGEKSNFVTERNADYNDN